MTQQTKSFEETIIADPVAAYQEFHSRLLNDGPNASFPEFKPTVDFVLKELQSPEFESVFSKHLDLGLELKEVKTLFAHVNLKFTFDNKDKYPYPEPFKAPFPYRPTIDAIEAGLRLLDKLNRLDPGNKAVPLYHFDRYAYHRHSLVADPGVIIFPTTKNLTFYDLIRVRSVPIGFIGVVSKTLRVDRHQQSPLDFWYHDLNHVRRMYGYINLRIRQRNAIKENERLSFFKEMDDFIVSKIIPNIVKLPAGATEEQIAIRRLVRIVFFEILHESALTAERETIIEDLLRGPGPQPFEHMVQPGDAHAQENIEKLRTPTGNIQSGVSVVQSTNNEPITIRYFFDRALALLANVYNKLNFGFYDDPENPSEFVVPVNYRKPEHIVAAAKNIFNILEVTNVPSDESLYNLITSKEGSEEKFVYRSLGDTIDKIGPSATEPISANEIIKKVKALHKTVYTLFGFSLLDYEHKDDVMHVIKLELSNLDPKTTLVNIGATQEGIGAAYKIAKELGFETIGIVSTQALFYSGKFSEFVDRVFIVNDSYWGGYIPGTKKLAETTKAFLRVSDTISAHGGGENTAAILREAHDLGIKTIYTPAEMNHEIAIQQAKLNNKQGDIDFNGAAYYTWKDICNLG